jgi:hypothetical protein
MLPIFDGIPDLCDLLISLVERKPHCSSLSIVAYHNLCNVIDSTRHALNHYFTLKLNKSFLQNSHIGTPYQKWAKFTNEDFQQVDDNLKSLFPIIVQLYNDISCTNNDYSHDVKSIDIWLDKVNEEYSCLRANPDEPSLTLTAICFNNWIDPSSLQIKDFCQYHLKKKVPIVTEMEISLADRSILTELQNAGIIRVEKMLASLEQFANWLETNCTLTDITARHREQAKYSKVFAAHRSLIDQREGEKIDDMS